jgi:hypothetical protein
MGKVGSIILVVRIGSVMLMLWRRFLGKLLGVGFGGGGFRFVFWI